MPLSFALLSAHSVPPTAHAVAFRAPTGAARCVAAAALVFFAPLLALVGVGVRLLSRGPMLTRVPFLRQDGRLIYLTVLRTRPVFDPETYDALALKPSRVLSVVGALLHLTWVTRLPVLLDVLSGRVGLTEAFSG